MLRPGAPPIVAQLAAACGTDTAGYVGEQQALSAFALEDGVVYHTYSTYARGVERLMATFGFLDVAPPGRNEVPRDPGAWWHRHDEYETSGDEAQR